MMSWPSALGTACISHGSFSSSMSWLLEALTWTGKEGGGGEERGPRPPLHWVQVGLCVSRYVSSGSISTGEESVNRQCRHRGQRRPRACAPGAESLFTKMTTNLALRHRSGCGRPLLVAKLGVEVGYGVPGPSLRDKGRVQRLVHATYRCTQYFTYMFARTHRLDTHTGVTRRQASEWNHPLGDRVLVPPSPRAVIWIMPARSVLNVLREVMTKRREVKRKGRGNKGLSCGFGTVKIRLPEQLGHGLVHPGETERGPHGWPGLG